MQINKHDLYTIDKAVEEISSILARGYLHYEKSRRLATAELGGPAANAKQGEDSGLVKEKGLACSGRQSVHAFTS
jgi:hypothetical protein